ncbi:MAG: hypothetical protein U5K28_06860 [Halobacteriales archaeon]|nr:hypothetical protein [Halobacteriales archaeon]
MFDDYEEWGNGIGRTGLGKPATASVAISGRAIRRMPDPGAPDPTAMIEEQAQDTARAGFLSAATEQGFIAWLNKCTHFCCVPGFKQLEGARTSAPKTGCTVSATSRCTIPSARSKRRSWRFHDRRIT